MKLRWKFLLCLAPVVLTLVGKLLVDSPKAKILVLEPTFYNISVDLLLAALGILLGSLMIGYRDPSIKDYAIILSALIAFSLVICLGLSVIVPILMGDPKGIVEIALSVIVPDLVAIAIFTQTVKIGT